MLTIEMSTTRFLLRKYDIIEQINSRDLAVGDTTEMDMFCANRGSGPSMDCLAQTVDRALSGQTVDRLRKAWIKLAQSVDVGQTVDSYC